MTINLTMPLLNITNLITCTPEQQAKGFNAGMQMVSAFYTRIFAVLAIVSAFQFMLMIYLIRKNKETLPSYIYLMFSLSFMLAAFSIWMALQGTILGVRYK